MFIWLCQCIYQILLGKHFALIHFIRHCNSFKSWHVKPTFLISAFFSSHLFLFRWPYLQFASTYAYIRSFWANILYWFILYSTVMNLNLNLHVHRFLFLWPYLQSFSTYICNASRCCTHWSNDMTAILLWSYFRGKSISGYNVKLVLVMYSAIFTFS